MRILDFLYIALVSSKEEEKKLALLRWLFSCIEDFRFSCSTHFVYLRFNLKLINIALLYLQELKQYPALRVEVGNAAIESLERMKEMSKKATLQLVDMESSYLTVDFFRKLPQDIDKGGNPTHSIFDRYNDSYLRRVGECTSKSGTFEFSRSHII